jgi:hypothetical protein
MGFDLEALAVYIKYVIRPRRVVHFSMDHGAFARECERIDLDALAIDCNPVNEALCSNVIYRDWRQLPVGDLQQGSDENVSLLILVTEIPSDGLYFTAPNLIDNWTSLGTILWVMNPQIDRWITDLGYRSYIVDVKATVHASLTFSQNDLQHVILKRTY